MAWYYVHEHAYGRRLITRDGPVQGLLEWPAHKWATFSKSPSKAKAIATCDAHPFHAVVTIGNTADKIHDNGKPAGIPDGWWPPEAQHAGQPRAA